MLHFHGQFKESKFMWELCMFHKLREFSDGLTLIDFDVNYDKYIGDHTPKFEVLLVLFNRVIVDFSIYNIYHADHEEYRNNH